MQEHRGALSENRKHRASAARCGVTQGTAPRSHAIALCDLECVWELPYHSGRSCEASIFWCFLGLAIHGPYLGKGPLRIQSALGLVLFLSDMQQLHLVEQLAVYLQYENNSGRTCFIKRFIYFVLLFFAARGVLFISQMTSSCHLLRSNRFLPIILHRNSLIII